MIPYGRHKIEKDDIDAVVAVLKSEMLTCGEAVRAFEDTLSQTVSSRYTVSCSSGTAALHLCMMALGIGSGDSVIVPGITFLASANAAQYVGADVVFADVDPATGLMTPETLEKAILENKEKNIKAIINVHMAGQCEDLESMHAIAKKQGIFLIEDAAHAIGSNYISKKGDMYPIGSNAFSDLTTFSFHPVKNIAMGEGGAVTTNSLDLKNKLSLFRNHAMERDKEKIASENKNKPWYYEMQHLGYNFRASDIHCALGISQLKKLASFKKSREESVSFYDQAFSKLEYLTPICKLPSCDPVWHLYVILIDFKHIEIPREIFMQLLSSRGIRTQVHYIPVYKQPYYKDLYGSNELPGCESYYKRCLSIPLFVGLSKAMQEKVIQEVLKHVK
mgnify:CR=1 FL=1|tara:strand:- start:5842 stop:7011 length:1170 start_codon:yes stop_codon:yes gene_type:complete